MSDTEKLKFMEKVTILTDTREQRNQHITVALDKLNVRHECKKLDFGDYSFILDGRDFSMSCIIERKANVNELWGNVTKDRARFEKEMSAAHSIAKSTVLLIEGVEDWARLKAYKVPDYEMIHQGRKIEDIGEYVFSTLKSWGCSNRYGFDVRFIGDNANSAAAILETFYWYYHNFREMLKPLKRI